ncbi:hypothetical protein SFUMM280S_01276 [Streptomyces fumanus]
MSAIIACTAGREALEAMPTRKATAAMATGSVMNPSSATDKAVEVCATSRVGRRPSRSVITPAPSEETTPPSPCSAATRPAYEAE